MADTQQRFHLSRSYGRCGGTGTGGPFLRSLDQFEAGNALRVLEALRAKNLTVLTGTATS